MPRLQRLTRPPSQLHDKLLVKLNEGTAVLKRGGGDVDGEALAAIYTDGIVERALKAEEKANNKLLAASPKAQVTLALTRSLAKKLHGNNELRFTKLGGCHYIPSPGVSSVGLVNELHLLGCYEGIDAAFLQENGFSTDALHSKTLVKTDLATKLKIAKILCEHIVKVRREEGRTQGAGANESTTRRSLL